MKEIHSESGKIQFVLNISIDMIDMSFRRFYFDQYSLKMWIFNPDMRILPLGSGGAILDWFLNYPDTKLVIQA
jgi:hypothetical protein